VKPEAIEAYLLGMQLWARQTPEDGTAAVRHFQRAVEIDPKFPEAYSGLSMAYPFLSLPHDEKLRRTREFAQRAVDLDPLFADGYVARGLHSFFAEWNWLSAEADFRRAIELNPNSRLALESCGSVLAASGRFEGAIALARRGVQLDPLSPLGRYSLVIYLYAGRSAEAVMALEAKRDVYGPTAQLGISYIFAGQVDKAVIELEAAERAAPATEATPALGYAYARAGRRAEALQVLAKWDQTPKNLAVGYWYPRAWIHVGLDDKGKALEDLELGYAQRDTWMVWSKVDPIFAPLRDEPRYQALLKKLELER
jgi:serine/threonine-protein kinase